MASGTKQQPGTLSREVAAILRAQMARRKILQTQVADATGISQTQLSGILGARKHVDLEQLDEICYALGLSFREVIAEADMESSSRHAEATWGTSAI